MATRTITDLLLDTSYLRGVGAPYHPDFQKLVALSKNRTIRIIVPHIAWEERRTQLVEEALAFVREARNAFQKVAKQHGRLFILGGLTPPQQVLWNDAEVYEKSKEVMKAVADDSKIDVVALGADHAGRAWERYFSTREPFNPEVEREIRRKDIPDSWILEAAIDLKVAYPNLRAVCGDKRLADALVANGIPVFLVTESKRPAQLTQEIVDAIQAELESPPTTKAGETKTPTPATGSEAVRRALDRAQSGFSGVDESVLGFVAYLGEVSKSQLVDLFTQKGVPAHVARNVAERLTIAGSLVDTGNHYLVADKEAGLAAAALVEAEIVELLKESR